jgi:hypothetical protein
VPVVLPGTGVVPVPVVPVVPVVVGGVVVPVAPVVPVTGGVNVVPGAVCVAGGVVEVDGVVVVDGTVGVVCSSGGVVEVAGGVVAVVAGASGTDDSEMLITGAPRSGSWLALTGTPGVASIVSGTCFPPSRVTTTRRFSADADVEVTPMRSAAPAASEAMRSLVLFIGPTNSSRTAASAALLQSRRCDGRLGSYRLFWTFAKRNPRVCNEAFTCERSSTEPFGELLPTLEYHTPTGQTVTKPFNARSRLVFRVSIRSHLPSVVAADTWR